MSLTQALCTPRSVLVARAMPSFMAASKLSGEMALISVTRATDIYIGSFPRFFPNRVVPYIPMPQTRERPEQLLEAILVALQRHKNRAPVLRLSRLGVCRTGKM